MIEPTKEQLAEEEHIVAELERLGIHYLSRQTAEQADGVRPSEQLLADLVRQPSARVRAAVIAVLLAHPHYAEAMPAAIDKLPINEQSLLRLLYTAAMLLQQAYVEHLRPFIQTSWQELPDLFSDELNVPRVGTPQERLVQLGDEHRRRTETIVNWVGTYHDVANRLLRQWELELQWSQ